MTILEMYLEKLFDKNEEIVRLVHCPPPPPGGGTPLFGQDGYVTLNKPWYSYSSRVYNFANISNSILNKLSFWMEAFQRSVSLFQAFR